MRKKYRPYFKPKNKYFVSSFPDKKTPDILFKKSKKSNEEVHANIHNNAKDKTPDEDLEMSNYNKIEEQIAENRKPNKKSKITYFRKFTNIDTYAALCHIGSSVVDKKSGIKLDKNVAEHIAREFETRIKEQAKTCSPKHASNWLDALSSATFNEHADWESIFDSYKDTIKNAIILSTQSKANERLALDWLKFAGRWADDSEYYSDCLSQCVEGLNGKEVSPMVAKEVCTILRDLNNGKTEIYDALILLRLPNSDNIWDKEYFRQAALSCLLDGYSTENIQNCMTEIKNEIISDHKLFETWGIVYVELRNSGVKFDS